MPPRYSDASAIKMLPLGVRQTLVWGKLDKIAPISLGQAYVAAAKRKDETVNFLSFNDSPFQDRDSNGPIVACLEKEICDRASDWSLDGAIDRSGVRRPRRRPVFPESAAILHSRGDTGVSNRLTNCVSELQYIPPHREIDYPLPWTRGCAHKQVFLGDRMDRYQSKVGVMTGAVCAWT